MPRSEPGPHIIAANVKSLFNNPLDHSRQLIAILEPEDVDAHGVEEALGFSGLLVFSFLQKGEVGRVTGADVVGDVQQASQVGIFEGKADEKTGRVAEGVDLFRVGPMEGFLVQEMIIILAEDHILLVRGIILLRNKAVPA